MKISSLVFIILFIGHSSIKAQQDAYHWRIGAHSGVMNYYGDLNQRFLAPNNAIINNTFEALSYGISVEKFLSQSWSNKLLYTNGKFYANDRAIRWNGNADADRSNYERSLNAKTDIQDLSLIFTYYFDNDKLLGRRAFISPYLALGLGVTNFQVFGDLYDDTGNRYYYWADNTIRNEEENSPSGINAVIIKQDGKYETNLTDLITEKAYNTREFNIPFGAGLKVRISSRLNLNLDYTARYAFTDYLDDVSGNYRNSFDNEIQAYASNPTNRDSKMRGTSGKNDLYSFASVSLHYNFGKKADKYIAPKIYPSPYYYQDPQKRQDRLDSLESRVTLDSLPPAIVTEPLLPEFNPIPTTVDSIIKIKSEEFTRYEGTSQEMSPTQPLTAPIGPAEFETKYRLQSDTIRQLEYEVKKLRLQNELYELRKNSPDASVKQRFREDSLGNSPITPLEKRPNSDTLKTNKIETEPSSKTNISDTSTFNGKNLYAYGMSAIQPPMIIEDGKRSNSTSTDAEGFNDTQNEINDSKITLYETEDYQKKYFEEIAAVNQLQRIFDASFLRNTQPRTRIIEKESTPSVGYHPPVQANIGVANLERRMDLLSGEVKNALSNQTTLDSISLLSLENAKKSEADLNKKIDTLNSQVQAAALKEDSLELRKVTAARDSLQNQVMQLQESLETLMSEKPDTVERDVITIPELPKTEVFFNVNSSVLSDNDKQRMREVANIISKYPQVQVIIEGFTDKTGSADYNLMLSKKRARAVEQVLILSNVSASRIITKSNGVDNNLKKKASRYGRRVEIIFFTPE